MQKALAREYLQECCDLWHELGRNTTELSRRLGKSRGACQNIVNRLTQLGLTPLKIPAAPDTSGLQEIIKGLRVELDKTRLERDEAHASLRIAQKPHFTIRQDNTRSSSKIRLVCIGDAHDSPAIPDKSRFRWIGEYVRDAKPDVVIQIGDFATLDSLSTHTPNETFQGKSKPTYMADMESFNNALSEMDLDGYEKHCTLGNHERRLFLFEDRAPEAYGMMQCELQKIFERHKWTFSPYGQITYYGGVGFVHAALNKLGKTYGGKTAENQIANDSIHDLVIGHSHTERRHRAAKIGGTNSVQILNVGCALPDGHIEEYAQHALTGWSYGIADLMIQHGHIQDYQFISMARLGETYGQA